MKRDMTTITKIITGSILVAVLMLAFTPLISLGQDVPLGPEPPPDYAPNHNYFPDIPAHIDHGAYEFTGSGDPFPEPIMNLINDPMSALADPLFSAIKNAAFELIRFNLYVFVLIFGMFTQFAVTLLSLVIEVDKFSKNPLVLVGWEFVRDALNFVFILAILVIAFATIAGIDGWNMRALLPRLLVAALLVNFSLAIGGTFIDFSRVLTSSLIGEARGDLTASEGLAKELMEAQVIANYYSYDASAALIPFNIDGKVGEEENPQAKDFFLIFVSVFFIIIITAVLLVTALFLFIRVIALWILLILSPVGFVFTILPQTKSLADKWWSEFIKYVMYGPVFIFFLVLAARIGQYGEPVAGAEGAARSGGLATLLYNSGNMPGNAAVQFLFNNEFMFSMFQTGLVILFIIFGLLTAQQMGVYAGGKAAGMVTGLTGTGMKLGVGTSRVAGRIPIVGKALGAPAAGYDATKGAVYGVKNAWGESQAGVEQKQRAGRGARAGALIGAPLNKEARSRVMDRQVNEGAEDMSKLGLNQAQTIDKMKNGNAVERRAAVMHALKNDYLDKPDDYRTALAVTKGTKQEKEVMKKFEKSNPILAHTNLSEQEYKTKPALVQQTISSLPPEQRGKIQGAINKAGDEAKGWDGVTVTNIASNGFSLGSGNTETIMKHGSKSARTAIRNNKNRLGDIEKARIKELESGKA